MRMRPRIPPQDRKKSAGPSEQAPSDGLPRQVSATSSLLVSDPEEEELTQQGVNCAQDSPPSA